jgi:hypothetical protein
MNVQCNYICNRISGYRIKQMNIKGTDVVYGKPQSTLIENGIIKATSLELCSRVLSASGRQQMAGVHGLRSG